eukprot:contig_13632_g3280
MGSNDGDASTASTQAQVISDLQAKLQAAEAAVTALQAVVDADAEKVPPAAPAQAPVLAGKPGGSGAVGGGVAADAGGGKGSRQAAKSRLRGGGGGDESGRSRSSSGAGRGGGGRPSPPSSSSSDEPELHHAVFDDIDAIKIGRPGVFLKDFDLPRRVTRPGGLPVPIEPSEVEFRATFADNVRDRMEATSLYQVRYWLQEAIHGATHAYHQHGIYTPNELEECLGGLFIYLKRIHRTDVKRFDFL